MIQLPNAPTRIGHVYAQIRERLMSGQLTAGTALKVADLCRDYGVSMSVVREALTRLSEQGLLQTQPNKGFIVTPLSLEDMWDLTFVRIEVETIALRRSIKRADIAWEAALLGAHHVLDNTPRPRPEHSSVEIAAWNEAHERFHRACAAACGSPRLLALRASLFDAAQIFRQYSRQWPGDDDRDVRAEHTAIFEACMARARDAAVAALRSHIQRTSQTIADLLPAALAVDP